MINAAANQSVAPNPTIKMTGAATPILDRVVRPAMPVVAAKTQVRVPGHRIGDVTTLALRLVERMIDVATGNRRKADATTPVHRAVNPIVGQTVAVLRRVNRMIDAVTRNHLKADVRTLARLAVSPIAGQIVLAHSLEDLMIDVTTSSRRKVDEVSSVRLPVVRAVVLVRRNMVPVTIAADSFRLIVAVGSFHRIVMVSFLHIAEVTNVDAAVSAPISVALITVEGA